MILKAREPTADGSGGGRGKNGRGRELNHEGESQTVPKSWSLSEWVGGVQASSRRGPGESVPASPRGLDALSRVLTRLTSRWPLGRVDQTDRGEAGRVAERSLTYAPIGVLFEVWLPLRKKRSGSAPPFKRVLGSL